MLTQGVGGQKSQNLVNVVGERPLALIKEFGRGRFSVTVKFIKPFPFPANSFDKKKSRLFTRISSRIV